MQICSLLDLFALLSPAAVAMEACGSSHHWVRRFASMGHEVRLMATKLVRPFVKSNKPDAADAPPFGRLPRGRHWALKAPPEAFSQLDGKISAMGMDALRTLAELIHDLTCRIGNIESQLEACGRSDERCKRLRAISGVGPLTAMAIVASVGDAKKSRCGRDFAAWLGVVPRQAARAVRFGS